MRVDAPKLWTVLAKCHKAISLLIEHEIADAGLCMSDFMVLEALLHKGPLTISEIQSKVLLASGSMTAAVDRVERKGLVVRTASSKDRRARSLQLTEEGRHIAQSVFRSHAKELAGLLSVLEDSEAQGLYESSKKLGLRAAEMLQQQRKRESHDQRSKE